MLQCISSQRISALIMVAVNCTKYSLKSENLGEKSKLPLKTSITLYLTLPTDTNAYASIYSPCNYTSVHIFPLNHYKVCFDHMWQPTSKREKFKFAFVQNLLFMVPVGVRNAVAYVYHIPFLCCIFATIQMENCTHGAMCMVSASISAFMWSRWNVKNIV